MIIYHSSNKSYKGFILNTPFYDLLESYHHQYPSILIICILLKQCIHKTKHKFVTFLSFFFPIHNNMSIKNRFSFTNINSTMISLLSKKQSIHWFFSYIMIDSQYQHESTIHQQTKVLCWIRRPSFRWLSQKDPFSTEQQRTWKNQSSKEYKRRELWTRIEHARMHQMSIDHIQKRRSSTLSSKCTIKHLWEWNEYFFCIPL